MCYIPAFLGILQAILCHLVCNIQLELELCCHIKLKEGREYHLNHSYTETFFYTSSLLMRSVTLTLFFLPIPVGSVDSFVGFSGGMTTRGGCVISTSVEGRKIIFCAISALHGLPTVEQGSSVFATKKTFCV